MLKKIEKYFLIFNLSLLASIILLISNTIVFAETSEQVTPSLQASRAWDTYLRNSDSATAIKDFYEIIEIEMNSASLPVLRSKLNLLEGLVRYLITTV